MSLLFQRAKVSSVCEKLIKEANVMHDFVPKFKMLFSSPEKAPQGMFDPHVCDNQCQTRAMMVTDMVQHYQQQPMQLDKEWDRIAEFKKSIEARKQPIPVYLAATSEWKEENFPYILYLCYGLTHFVDHSSESSFSKKIVACFQRIMSEFSCSYVKQLDLSPDLKEAVQTPLVSTESKKLTYIPAWYSGMAMMERAKQLKIKIRITVEEFDLQRKNKTETTVVFQCQKDGLHLSSESDLVSCTDYESIIAMRAVIEPQEGTPMDKLPKNGVPQGSKSVDVPETIPTSILPVMTVTPAIRHIIDNIGMENAIIMCFAAHCPFTRSETALEQELIARDSKKPIYHQVMEQRKLAMQLGCSAENTRAFSLYHVQWERVCLADLFKQ